MIHVDRLSSVGVQTMGAFQNPNGNGKKAETRLRFGEETISVFGLEGVFETLYFDGWKPSDERFEEYCWLCSVRHAIDCRGDRSKWLHEFL